MNREEYELIKDLVGEDEEWMQQVGIQNPEDIAPINEWNKLSPEEKTKFIESSCINREPEFFEGEQTRDYLENGDG